MSTNWRKHRQHCHWSKVADYPRVKKSEEQHVSSLLLTLKRPVLVAGDVIVEFFNKPKMMKKVFCYELLACMCWTSDSCIMLTEDSFCL